MSGVRTQISHIVDRVVFCYAT